MARTGRLRLGWQHLVVIAGFCLIWACSLQAQTTANASDLSADALPEVIVTAEKRSENLQDVPISVTALSGDTITKLHLENPADLAGLIPNLQMQNTVGDEIPIFSLRGVSMSDFSLNQASPVATYYDEVYKGNFALLGVSMFDLQRIEVLRGPQGTLYGKNTTGGAINLVANKPGFDTEGYVSAGYGNYNRREITGAFQTGFTDTLAGRIAFSYTRQDGWFENLLAGHPDMNATNEFGIRASLLFRPIDGLEFVLRGSLSNESSPNYGIYGQPYTALGCIGAGVYSTYHDENPVANPFVDDCRAGLGKRQLRNQYTQDRENRTYSVALTTTWRIQEHLMVTAVSSWDQGTLLIPEDSDGSYLGVINEPYADRAHQVAQDLRIASDFAGPFNFIAGAYYNLEDVFNSTTFSFYNRLNVPLDGVYYGAGSVQSCEAGIPLGLLDCNITNSFFQRKRSEALYTDLSFAASQHFTLRGGVRYTHDQGDQSDFSSNILSTDNVFISNFIPGPAPVTGLSPGCIAQGATAECSFSKGEVTGKLGLDYKTDAGNLLYVSASRGYRASGFNAQAFFQPSELSVAKPETINAYEVGSKTQVLDNHLQVNSALFYYQYQNQQVLSTNPVTAAQTLINLSRSRIAGAEFELVAKPARTLTLSSGFGLLSTRVEEGLVSGVSVAGTKLANAPRLSASAAADWTFFSTHSWTGALRLDGTYATGQYFDPFNHLYQPGYGLVNARLSLRSADDRWGMALWGKNLFDTFYLTSRIDVPGFGFIYNHEGTPTMFGVTFDYHF